jgi:hypothetical protein
MGQRRRRSHEERGFILVLSLLFLLVVTLLAVSGMNTAVYETRLSGNKRVSEQAFYVAEAGIHEFMGRYGSPSSVETFDPSPSDPDWKLFLATHEERAREIGYRPSGSQSLVQSLQNQLDFAVEVRHKVNSANHVVTSRGYPVYVVTSHGHTPDFGLKVVEVEVNRGPSIDAPSALYSKAPVNLRGSSTLITGMDQCGNGNKPGIITTSPVINESGNPKVLGTTPEMTNSDLILPLKDMIDYFKDWADFTYRYSRDQTLTGYLDAWGAPVGHGTGTPLSYPDTAPVQRQPRNQRGVQLVRDRNRQRRNDLQRRRREQCHRCRPFRERHRPPCRCWRKYKHSLLQRCPQKSKGMGVASQNSAVERSLLNPREYCSDPPGGQKFDADSLCRSSFPNLSSSWTAPWVIPNFFNFR